MEELADAAIVAFDQSRESDPSEIKIPKKKKMLKSKRAGIIFPVTRTRKKLAKAMTGRNGRVSEDASVFLSGALETITSEVFNIACDKTAANNRKRITPSEIQFALDESDIYTGDAYMRGATRVTRATIEWDRNQELRRLQQAIIHGEKKDTDEPIKKPIKKRKSQIPVKETSTPIKKKRKRIPEPHLESLNEKKPEKKIRTQLQSKHNIQRSTNLNTKVKNAPGNNNGGSLSSVMKDIINGASK